MGGQGKVGGGNGPQEETATGRGASKGKCIFHPFCLHVIESKTWIYAQGHLAGVADNGG